MIAHVGGIPLEEILPTLPGAGAFLLLARARLMLRLRPGRRDTPPPATAGITAHARRTPKQRTTS